MPTVQQILENVNSYRNSYSTAQKVGWMDTVQKQIFQDVPHEAPPYTFVTTEDFAFYPLPADCDPLGLKQLMIETKAGSGKYEALSYVSIESNDRFSDSDEFYTIQGNENLYLNPLPTAETAGRAVYLVYNKRPEALSTANLSAIPDLEEDFHELLELGVKVRIARERGEVLDKNNFQADFNTLYLQYTKRYKNNFPEYPKTKDVTKMPRRGMAPSRRGGNWDLIPH
jgi:hypothetical protein